VLGYGVFEVGFVFVLISVVMVVCSLWVLDWLVMWFGICPLLVVGLALAVVSLVLFFWVLVGGDFFVDVLLLMLLLGVGVGIVFNLVLLAVMGDVELYELGLVFGVVNILFMMGGAFGLVVLVSIFIVCMEFLAIVGSVLFVVFNGGF